MDLSSLNLSNFFLNLFTFSPPKLFTLQICTETARSAVCSETAARLPPGCHVLGNTKYSICYVSCLCQLWFYRSLLQSPESSFPSLKTHRFLILLPEEAPPNLWVSMYLYCVPFLWRFQQVNEISCVIQENWCIHIIHYSKVRGHKASADEVGSKTWNH